MKPSHVVAWLGMLVLAASPLAAQSPVPSIARCRALMDSVRGSGPPDFSREQHTLRPCVQALSIDSTPPDQLVTLAWMFHSINDDGRAALAIERRLADANLAPAERIRALRIAFGVYSNVDTTLDRSRSIARTLDSLDPANLPDRLATHAALLRQADVYGTPADRRREAGGVLDVATLGAGTDSLGRERRIAVRDAMASLADVLALESHGDSVAVLIDALQRRFADLPSLHDELQPIRARYAMIGRRAPAPRADDWLGAGGPVIDWRGKVHVLEFSAHWCGPCHASYPSLVALANSHASSDLGIVISTATYGWFGDDTALAPQAELARDRAMYARELPIPASIAVERRPVGAGDDWRGTNAQAYAVKGLPVFVIIDRAGIVRDVWFGWMATSRARLERDVVRALAIAGSGR